MLRTFAALALLWSVSWGVNQAHAGRLVDFEVLLDGQKVLVASRLDWGAEANTVWNYLKTLPLRKLAETRVVNESESKRLSDFYAKLDKQGPTKATLKGDVQIFCRYAGEVTVAELRLVRKDPQSPWLIDPSQVDELSRKRVIDPAMRVREQVDEAQKERAKTDTGPVGGKKK